MTRFEKPPNYDLNAAVWAADSFYSLSRHFLEEKREKGILLGQIISSSTNLAFAVELFLKALRVSCSISPLHHHDLSALFKQLPQDVKKNCIAKYDAMPTPDLAHVTSFGVYTSLDPSFLESGDAPTAAPRPVPPQDNSLPAVLKRNKDAFEVWRYFYERGSPGQVVRHAYEFHYLGNAAMAIRGVLSERHQVASNPP